MNEETPYIKEREIVDIPTNTDLTISAQTVKRNLLPYWSRDEINIMLNEVKNPKHQMLFRFLWMSGVRITEAINLKKADIDFDNFIMTVKWLKSRKYHNRVVPVHPLLQSLLQVYTGAMKLDELVFPISRQRAWQLCKKHGFGNPHKFRHSFAVNWLRSDADIVILHRILGHSKFQTTLEYLKVVPIEQGKELIKVTF